MLSLHFGSEVLLQDTNMQVTALRPLRKGQILSNSGLSAGRGEIRRRWADSIIFAERMDVLFSRDVFGLQRYGGVSRYYVELHKGLWSQGIDSRIVGGLHDNPQLVGVEGVIGGRASGIGSSRVRRALGRLGGLACEEALLVRYPSCIYHPTYFPRRVPPKRNPLAITVYDMINEKYGLSAAISERKRRWCCAAGIVFAISRNTKRELIEYFKIPEEKIVVTHLGCSTAAPQTEYPLPPHGPFILYVGNRAARHKNFLGMAEALANSVLLQGVSLACFGGGPILPEEWSSLKKMGLADRIVTAAGKDRDLYAYYSHALALVYPSFDEGFGLPPLEAMRFGCPVACSFIPPLLEVVGDAAQYFDPSDLDSITGALEQVVFDEQVRRELVGAGRQRSAEFTWEHTVLATVEGYSRLFSI